MEALRLLASLADHVPISSGIYSRLLTQAIAATVRLWGDAHLLHSYAPYNCFRSMMLQWLFALDMQAVVLLWKDAVHGCLQLAVAGTYLHTHKPSSTTLLQLHTFTGSLFEHHQPPMVCAIPDFMTFIRLQVQCQ